MPPSSVHLNGGVNLAGPEEVFRELGARIGNLAYAYPDGETGDRNYWIWFQLPRLQAPNGLVDAPDRENFLRGDTIPQVGLAHGVSTPEAFYGIFIAQLTKLTRSELIHVLRKNFLSAKARFKV